MDVGAKSPGRTPGRPALRSEFMTLIQSCGRSVPVRTNQVDDTRRPFSEVPAIRQRRPDRDEIEFRDGDDSCLQATIDPSARTLMIRPAGCDLAGSFSPHLHPEAPASARDSRASCMVVRKKISNRNTMSIIGVMSSRSPTGRVPCLENFIEGHHHPRGDSGHGSGCHDGHHRRTVPIQGAWPADPARHPRPRRSHRSGCGRTNRG